MKLIIKQYLASLKEREELDAILPDLLSQLGLNVFSRPSRGTRQDGVDVAAVGKLNGEEKVYLFSIKAGDLTRNFWDGDALQSLRPSLNEIRDAYIHNRLPTEHKNKPIVICLFFGGDIQEQVRPQVEGYIKQNTTNNISFEEWNGDKLAALISENFLREDLLPENARSQLRKSLALLDEPESSYKHFSSLIHLFSNPDKTTDKEILMRLRQINICLWILFSWARDTGNLESAYLSSELSLLYSLELAKSYFPKKIKKAKEIQSVFCSIFRVHQKISSDYLKKIFPHIFKLHALSSSIRSSSNIDVNLKMFDVLGRLAMHGILLSWNLQIINEDAVDVREQHQQKIQGVYSAIQQLINNNPVLFLPIKDDQAIDIAITLFFLMSDDNNNPFIQDWLNEIIYRADFAFLTNGQYPCHVHSYAELLEHPQRNNEGYREEVTAGSVLFPMIAFWAALLKDDELYKRVQYLKKTHLPHCNFQFWYPCEDSEQHFYKNTEIHGAALSNVHIESSMDLFEKQIVAECEKTADFKELSAVKMGLYPIILMACRHYRLPIPLHFWNIKKTEPQ